MSISNYMHESNKKRLEELKALGFEFSIWAGGYFIKHESVGVGGAGILGKSRAHGRARIQDAREYTAMAIRTAEQHLHEVHHAN